MLLKCGHTDKHWGYHGKNTKSNEEVLIMKKTSLKLMKSSKCGNVNTLDIL